MEILSNFSSAYCFISFIIGAMFMFVAICIAAMSKVEEPMNKVHFYVARDIDDFLFLYMGKPFRYANCFNKNVKMFRLMDSYSFKSLGLNEKDFQNLKWKDEPIEVFLNLED